MKYLFIIAACLLTVTMSMAQEKLEKSVTASGATNASNSEINLQGTVGQRFTGKASNGAFNIGIGFWESVITRMSTSIIVIDPTVHPGKIYLGQNSPNPADQETRIEIQIPTRSEVRLCLIGINGKILGDLHNGVLYTGKYVISTDVSHLPQGQYLYALIINNSIVRKRSFLVFHGQ